MKWFRLRRAQSEGTKLRSFRFPNQLSERLDARARFEGKTVTEVVMRALENLLSETSASTEESVIFRLSRQIKEAEGEVERLQREEAFVDAKKKLEISGLTSREITWFTNDTGVTKDSRHIRFTRQQYDQWVTDKPVLEKIVADYEGTIRGLQDKIGLLKAEIAKS